MYAIRSYYVEDGQQRTFNNDMDSDLCCCYLGMRKEWRLGFDGFERPSSGRLARRGAPPRLGGPR